MSDAEGRFVLAGVKPGKTVILVERAGFRLQGGFVDPSAHADLGLLTLAREDETPGRVIKPLADPIPQEESRALADRLLEPYLRPAMENGDDRPDPMAISALSEFDVDRALKLLQSAKFPENDFAYHDRPGIVGGQACGAGPRACPCPRRVDSGRCG